MEVAKAAPVTRIQMPTRPLVSFKSPAELIKNTLPLMADALVAVTWLSLRMLRAISSASVLECLVE